MYYSDGNVIIEEDDLCTTCANLNKGIACPLIQALAQGVVFIDDSLCVSNCGFYMKFERHLRLVVPLHDDNQ